MNRTNTEPQKRNTPNNN